MRHIGSWRDLGRVALDEYAAAEREVTRLRAELSALREQAARNAPLMSEAAMELRYAATHTPWRPSPEVVHLCRRIADKLDDAARAALSEPTLSTTGTNNG